MPEGIAEGLEQDVLTSPHPETSQNPLNRSWQPPSEIRIDLSQFSNTPTPNEINDEAERERFRNYRNIASRHMFTDMSGSMNNSARLDFDRILRSSEMTDEQIDRHYFDGQWENLFGQDFDVDNYLSETKVKVRQQVVERHLESISAEAAKRLIEASRSEPINQPVYGDESTKKALWGITTPEAQKLAIEFYSILRGQGTPDAITDETEMGFIEAAKKELDNLKEDVDPRIIKSQITALHSLIYSGGLDFLYRKYKTACAKKGIPFPTDELEITDIKSKLATDFLDRLRLKDAEQEWSEIPSGNITVGMEIEYTSFIGNELKTCGIYETLLAEFNKNIENATHPVVREVYEKAKKKVQTRLNILKSIIKDRDSDAVEGAFRTWEPGTQASIQMDLITDRTVSGKEVATKPSASYRTQLRELVAISTIGGLRSNWGVHETFGGVELSTKHTEFMDALPIATAAGFVDFDKVSETLQKNVDLGYGVTGEIHKKSGSQGERGSFYFPFHKPRNLGELDVVANQQNQNGIELRSLPEYNQKGFNKLVRQLSFHYLFAHGVKSIQKEESQRTPQDNELVAAYNDLMTDWTRLLQTKNITIPTNDERYLRGSLFFGTEKEDELDSNKYIVYLSRMIILAQNDPEFSKKTRELVRKYTGNVRRILGEK